MKYIKFLDEITDADAAFVGGKAFALAKLTQAGILIPPAFVVTTKAYDEFSTQDLSQEFIEEVTTAVKQLHADKVAVRSSALAEDGGNHSWAGQLESYLNIEPQHVVENIQKCWAALSSPRAVAYGRRGKNQQTGTAVIVQQMIKGEVSGVLFTVHPVTQNRSQMVLEAVYGLGELLVQGEVTPANFVIDRDSGTVVSHQPSDQWQHPGQEMLSSSQLKKLHQLALQIETFFGRPQDIEWTISREEVFILQSRPITTLR